MPRLFNTAMWLAAGTTYQVKWGLTGKVDNSSALIPDSVTTSIWFIDNEYYVKCLRVVLAA